MSKFKVFGLACCLTVAGLNYAPLANAKAKVQQLDSIAAVVNDGVITDSEVNQQLQALRKQLQTKNVQLPSNKILREQVLNHLIDIKIQLQLAKRNHLKITDQQLQKEIANIAKGNKMSVKQLRAQLSKSGFNYKQYKEDLRKQLLLRQVQQAALRSKVQVSKQEINDFAKKIDAQQTSQQQYHLKNILIPLPENPNPQQIASAKQRAKKILQKLEHGGDFSTAAVSQSGGNAALSGGDLGWRHVAELPSAFADKVSQMKAGQVAGPIRTANGFHLIKLVAKKGATAPTLTATHVRHILIKTDAKHSNSQVKAELIKLRKEIVHGKSFASVAKKYSQDVGASNGGDLGWVYPHELVPAFEKTMNHLKVGQVSQPVHTGFGWHLIQVLGRKHIKHSKKLEQQQAYQMLFRRKFEQAMATWMQHLRTQSYVKIYKQTA